MSNSNNKPGILLPPAVGYSLKIVCNLYKTNSISLKYYPRLLAIIVINLINLPFRTYERFVINPRFKKKSIDKEPVFILGHWRSGTTHLHNLLCQDPQMGYTTTFQSVFPDTLFNKTGRFLFENFTRLLIPGKRKGDNVSLGSTYPQEEEFALGDKTPISFYYFWMFPRNIMSYYNSYIRFRGIEVDELDNMVEKNDFILILVETNVDERVSFEMGLAYTAGKPVVLLVSGDISNINPIFSKAATITQKLDYAITVLRLFSIIKSGEILEVDKEERERMAGFLKSIERIEIPQPKIEFPSYIEEKERMADFLKPMEGIEILGPKIELKPSLIEEEMPLKQKQGRLGGDKV